MDASTPPRIKAKTQKSPSSSISSSRPASVRISDFVWKDLKQRGKTQMDEDLCSQGLKFSRQSTKESSMLGNMNQNEIAFKIGEGSPLIQMNAWQASFSFSKKRQSIFNPEDAEDSSKFNLSTQSPLNPFGNNLEFEETSQDQDSHSYSSKFQRSALNKKWIEKTEQNVDPTPLFSKPSVFKLGRQRVFLQSPKSGPSSPCKGLLIRRDDQKKQNIRRMR